MFRLPKLLLMATWLAPATAVAQVSDTAGLPRPRIRVAYSCKAFAKSGYECDQRQSAHTATGALQAAEGDTLRLVDQKRGEELAIPVSAVKQMWISDGDKGHFVDGALVGLVTGAALGAAIGSQLESCLLSCGPSTEYGAMVGAPAGLLIGGIIGALIKSERWRETTVDALQVEIAPRLDQPGLAMSIQF
jgi:hypothetical protein